MNMNMNSTKKEAAYCQINAQMSGEYGITRDYSKRSKSKWEILRSQIMGKQVLKQKSLKTSLKVSIVRFLLI